MRFRERKKYRRNVYASRYPEFRKYQFFSGCYSKKNSMQNEKKFAKKLERMQ